MISVHFDLFLCIKVAVVVDIVYLVVIELYVMASDWIRKKI